MERERRDKDFGEIVREIRHQKGWTIKKMIEELKTKGANRMSPAYITRIEQYKEIPSPDLICLMADVLGYDLKKLLDCAKEAKRQRYDKTLEEKYKKAVGFYRKQSSNANRDK